MANLAGFMPQPGPGAIYGGDWSQPYSGIMDTLLQAQQAGQQRAWDQSPSGPSFNRRFGGMLPPSLNMPSAPVQQQADPQALAALQGALAGAADQYGQFIPNAVTRKTGVPYAGPMIDASEGPLRGQPWYDEYIAAAQAGAELPMVMGNAQPMSPEARAMVEQRRQERLGGTLPMADRRANIRNSAIAESEQRAVRMGDMSGNQQYFNELTRLQGALGGQDGGGGNVMNIALGGPEFAAAIDRNNAERDTTNAKLKFAGSPEGWVAGAFSNGMPVPDVFGGQRAIQDPMGASVARLAALSPDRETFLNNAAALGIPLDVAQQKAAEMFPPKEPGFLGKLFGFGQETIPRPAYTKPENAGGAYPIPYG